MSGKKEIDYLKEDPPVSGQKYVLLSFLSPEGIKNCKIRGLKVRGVYDDYELAKKKSEELRNTIEQDFHIFIGEVGKWLPWDPEPTSVGEEDYAERELNSLMKAYKENQAKAKQMYEQRKTEMVNSALLEQENRKKANKERASVNVSKLIDTKKQIDTTSEKVSQEKTVLESKETHAKEAEKEVKQVENELEKLKAMYDSFLNKKQ